MLKVTDVKKAYGKFTVLEDINLEVADGEFLAIMGPSGSGKSTLINILGLLDQSYTGEYLLEGKNYQSVNDNELSQIRGDQLGPPQWGCEVFISGWYHFGPPRQCAIQSTGNSVENPTAFS